MSMDYAGCSSDKDLVTFVDWTEEAPNVFINFRDDPTKPGRMNCYNGDSLKYWLNQPENTFAKWVRRDEMKPMDTMGYGGMPDHKYKYIKMYTGEYIVADDITRKLQKGVKYPVVLDADYDRTERIGNLAGVFGIGDVHGQVPGYRVYQLKTDKPLELETEEVITEETGETTNLDDGGPWANEGDEESDEEELVESDESDEEDEDDDLMRGEADRLADVLGNVRPEHPENNFGLALSNYLFGNVFADIKEKESLANRIAFAMAIYTHTSRNPANEAKLIDLAREYIKVLYDGIGDEAGKEATPAFLASQEFVDQMRMRILMAQIYKSHIHGAIDGNEAEDFKEQTKKYKLKAKYFLIEALARWGVDERDIGAGWIEDSAENLTPSTQRTPISRRKIFLSILARSRVAANFDMSTYTRDYMFGDGGHVAIEKLYEEIMDQDVTLTDTFKNMRVFYKKLPKTKINEIYTLI